ncbi:hypothetical protein ACFU90_22780 [Streptomyces noursei]|uniref:hypothetical protein n=1 Tax=Streptomyces noursei TaxID=1971 RepID=UPI00045EFF10|nr:hypothetical protein [Streptomyces noursei]AIA01473.1 tectonin 1 [Streptomyces noursei]
MTAGYWFAPPAAYDALLHTASRYDPLRHRSAHFVALVDTVTGTVLLLNSMPRRSSSIPLGVVGSNAFVSASAQSRHRRLAPERPRPANTSTSSWAALMDELGPDDQANSTVGHQTAGRPRPGLALLVAVTSTRAGGTDLNPGPTRRSTLSTGEYGPQASRYTGYDTHPWIGIPGKAVNIGAAADGTVWHVNADGGIYRCTGDQPS